MVGYFAVDAIGFPLIQDLIKHSVCQEGSNETGHCFIVNHLVDLS